MTERPEWLAIITDTWQRAWAFWKPIYIVAGLLTLAAVLLTLIGVIFDG